MGFSKHTAAKKQEAIKLRLEGKSYNQIRKALELPSKGTLSSWFRHLRLPTASQERLQKNIQLATERGLLKFNRERSKKIALENKEALKEGRSLVKLITERELLFIGAALYWGEGTKYFRNRRTAGLRFTNSDAGMIAFYMRFIREILKVPEIRIRCGVSIYPGLDKEKTRKYWSKVTGLPPERFWLVTAVSRASKGTKKWNKLPYGTCVINISSRLLFHKVMGIINGLIDKAQSGDALN